MKQRTGLGRRGKVVRLAASEGGETGYSRRPPKKRVTMFLDADVLAWFKGQERRYQSEINQVLRKVMTTEKERGE